MFSKHAAKNSTGMHVLSLLNKTFRKMIKCKRLTTKEIMFRSFDNISYRIFEGQTKSGLQVSAKTIFEKGGKFLLNHSSS